MNLPFQRRIGQEIYYEKVVLEIKELPKAVFRISIRLLDQVLWRKHASLHSLIFLYVGQTHRIYRSVVAKIFTQNLTPYTLNFLNELHNIILEQENVLLIISGLVLLRSCETLRADTKFSPNSRRITLNSRTCYFLEVGSRIHLHFILQPNGQFVRQLTEGTNVIKGHISISNEKETEPDIFRLYVPIILLTFVRIRQSLT